MSNLKLLELLNKHEELSEELTGFKANINNGFCDGEDCADDDCGGVC